MPSQDKLYTKPVYLGYQNVIKSLAGYDRYPEAVFLALWRIKQENHKFESILGTLGI